MNANRNTIPLYLIPYTLFLIPYSVFLYTAIPFKLKNHEQLKPTQHSSGGRYEKISSGKSL